MNWFVGKVWVVDLNLINFVIFTKVSKENNKKYTIITVRNAEIKKILSI